MLIDTGCEDLTALLGHCVKKSEGLWFNMGNTEVRSMCCDPTCDYHRLPLHPITAWVVCPPSDVDTEEDDKQDDARDNDSGDKRREDILNNFLDFVDVLLQFIDF